MTQIYPSYPQQPGTDTWRDRVHGWNLADTRSRSIARV